MTRLTATPRTLREVDAKGDGRSDLLAWYGCGPVKYIGEDDASGHFNRREPDLFVPIRDALLTHGDYYMHLADLSSYAATQARVSDLYADRQGWGRKAVLNVARSGMFSSDRTIAEYAESIWGATPCPVDEPGSTGMTASRTREFAS